MANVQAGDDVNKKNSPAGLKSYFLILYYICCLLLLPITVSIVESSIKQVENFLKTCTFQSIKPYCVCFIFFTTTCVKLSFFFLYTIQCKDCKITIHVEENGSMWSIVSVVREHVRGRRIINTECSLCVIPSYCCCTYFVPVESSSSSWKPTYKWSNCVQQKQ